MVTIYQIRCTENGMKYVGCTKGKLAKRLREHRCLLRAGMHGCQRLQEDWTRWGEDAFDILTLAILPEDASVSLKREMELRYMRQFRADGSLYNGHIISYSPPSGAQALGAKQRVANGYRPSPESNEKRRLAQLGKPKGHGAKISATKQARKAAMR